MAEPEGEVTRVLKRVTLTLDEGKYDQALRELLHLSEKYPDAGDIRPQIAETFLRRGELRARKGKPHDAVSDFERSLQWSRTPGALVALARVLMGQGNRDQASTLLNQALELDARFAPTHEALGTLLLRWGEYDEAVKAFEEALSLGHATGPLYCQAWEAYMHLERLDRAHEVILEGARRFAKNDAVQAAAGDSFVYAKGDSAGAPPYWERAVQLNPMNFNALFGLAGDAAMRGDRARALDLLWRCAGVDMERTRKMWRDDLDSPLNKFGAYAKDPEFQRLFGTKES